MIQLSESPTEYTARYAKVVPSVQDAFVFVMAHMDKVGADVEVLITPVWAHGHGIDGEVIAPQRMFEVAVSGMVELPEVEQ